MTNKSRTELRTLREVAHFLLPLVCCEFCRKPLLDPKMADKVFGDKRHTPLKKLKLTVHHRNGKHRDNKREKYMQRQGSVQYGDAIPKMLSQFAICGNTSLAHRPCHQKYEMTLTHKEKGLKKK